ncbi:MAG: anti-sigma factor family protein [Terriglobales bacterium]
MVMDCHDVLRQFSNYLEDDLDPGLREQVEAHLAQCRHCAAFYDSARNIVVLIADERTFTLPAGFRQRLHARLAGEIKA